MITLFQFPPAFNVPNVSPFCLKLETFLRLAGLEYQVKPVMDPRKGPKGKLPFITLDGKAIADTAIIMRTLQQYYEFDLDAGLDARGAVGRYRSPVCATSTWYRCWCTSAGSTNRASVR